MSRPKKPIKERRDETLGVRVKSPVKAVLQKTADADGRSMANLIERILIDWLKQNGKS